MSGKKRMPKNIIEGKKAQHRKKIRRYNPTKRRANDLETLGIRLSFNVKGNTAAGILFIVSAVFSVVFASEGLYIPAGVFGLLLILTCFIPVRKEIQLILSAAFGFPLLIFSAYPWAGAVTLLLIMTGIFYLGGQKLSVKSGVAFVVCAALGGVIMSLSQTFAALGITAGIAVISAYCIFVRIFRMKKSLKVKVI
ncbi:MAG TPA: hypothetical protein O0X42_03320 [Methanocorpusculum sp.]|nr:hypothetical protein [Methanocorpusculum sp.]